MPPSSLPADPACDAEAQPELPGLSLTDAVLGVAPRADPGHHDELRDALGGGLRPAWQRFFDWMGGSSAGLYELGRRAALVDRQIRENGVTFNVYGPHAQASATRPWQLGVLPFLIEPADWRVLEAGVIQRARLMQAIAEDVYGPQHLLHEGLLPPALVLGHSGYLRALQGARPPGGMFVHLCAFDLGHGPDGHWRVVSQRTQAPSGLGYVLENRIILSRLFPEAFRELRVQHLASGYRRLLDTLQQLAAPLARGGSPRVALWTPGPHNETYFEHAYLARYLGLPLVEGADLTVRDSQVFLKTVQGLEPVHGLLRRVDDDWCDPLELRADSTLGVPGLLQAVRAGRVLVANALGTGFLESPAIHGFLPGLSRRLLGEELGLPSLPTWWCGEQAAWEATQHALAERVVRATYRGGSRYFEPVIGKDLDAAGLEAWRRRVERDPDAHTLQERLAFSQTPLWHGERLEARTALLRVYAVADARGGWHVLPGGMTRVSAGDPHFVSMQQGSSSLDTWVLTEGPVDTFSMLRRRAAPDELSLRHRPVASRTAENLYWMGRYTERTEHLVRLAQACEALVDDDAESDDGVRLAVSRLAVQTGLAPWGVPTLVQAPRLFERAVLAAMADPTGAHGATSIAWNLDALRRCAGALRDRLSPEHWRLVSSMREQFAARLSLLAGASAGGAEGFPLAGLAAPELQGALEHLADRLAAVTGAQSDRMTRDDGWRLLTVGRLTERLVLMAGVLEAFCRAGDEDEDEDGAEDAEAARAAARPEAQVPALLSVQGFDLALGLFDSTITFRARYQRRNDLLALMDLLVLDESNPRALACVLRRLRTEIGKLPSKAGAAWDTEGVGGMLALLPTAGAGLSLQDLLQFTAGEEAEEARGGPLRPPGVGVLAPTLALARRLGAVGQQLSDEIGRRYFAHADGFDRLIL